MMEYIRIYKDNIITAVITMANNSVTSNKFITAKESLDYINKLIHEKQNPESINSYNIRYKSIHTFFQINNVYNLNFVLEFIKEHELFDISSIRESIFFQKYLYYLNHVIEKISNNNN
jgi:hypothetical protein